MKKIFWLMIFLVYCTVNVYAFDWQKLHEAADKITSQQAKGAADEKNQPVDREYVLALVLLNEHKDNEAGQIFHSLIRSDSKEPAFKWGVAEVLRRQHKTKEAQEILDEIIAEHPDFAPAYITLAYIKYTQLDFNGSVKLAAQVARMGQGKVDRSNIVRAYLLLGGNKGMIAHYGGALSKMINGTQVLPYLKKAQALKPDDAGVLFGLGSFYFMAPALVGGDRVKALEYLERAVKVDPLFADAYVRLAQIYNMQGDKAKYKSYLTKALSIDPQNVLALDARAGKCKFICFSLEK